MIDRELSPLLAIFLDNCGEIFRLTDGRDCTLKLILIVEKNGSSHRRPGASPLRPPFPPRAPILARN